ncbi:MAG: DUF4835 family protein [Bacteroidota bacterium]|nr:DUF4835 family protein [Bacteroidota bacterium]
MFQKSIILILSVLLFTKYVNSQELNCNVTVVSKQIQSTDKHVYDNMREGIMEFMKGQVWTEDKYKPVERIECNYYIKIDDRPQTDKFKGNIQVQSVRPAFGTNYNSTVLNVLDKKITFDYVEFATIDFNEGSFTSNLASILSYYAYIILGLDYDSFSKYGGTPYYQKAQEIVNQAQGKGYEGWDAFSTEKNNRYWLVNQLLDPRFKPLREAIYIYHRNGLDKMTKEKEASRHAIGESLQLLKKVHRDEPDSYLLRQFLTSKRNEIIKIYSNATATEIDELKSLMKEIDPANYSKYSEKLKK